jgi:hypothetical protein
MAENYRAVLGAYIRTLAVEGGGIMHFEEQLNQARVSALCRIECYFDDLGVSGTVGADLSISGVINLAPAIAADSVNNPGDLPEKAFNAPEAPSPKSCLFHPGPRLTGEIASERTIGSPSGRVTC